MADFNVDLAPAKGAGASPLAPVKSAPVDLSNVAGAINIAGNIWDAKAKLQNKADLKAAEDAVVGKYNKEQSVYDQGFEAGTITAREHAAKSRLLLGQYLSTYPQYTEALGKANTIFRSGGSISETGDINKSERDLFNERVKAAERDGIYFPPGSSNEVKETGIRLHAAVVAARKEQEDTIRTNSEARAQGTWEQTQRDAEVKRRAAATIGNLVATQMEHFQKTVEFFQNKITLDPSSSADSRQQLSLHVAQIKASLAAAAGTNPELAGPYMTVFGELFTAADKMLDPKVRAEDAKALFEQIKYKAVLLTTADPEVKGAIAVTTIFPNTTAANLYATNAAVKAFSLAMSNEPGSNKVPPIIGTSEEKYVLEGAKDTLAKLFTDKLNDPESSKKQAANLVNNVLTQTGELGDRYGVDPAKFSKVVDLLTSPHFAKLVESGMVSKPALESAKRAVQGTWEKEVIRRVGTALDDQLYHQIGTQSVSVRDSIVVEFSGSGVRIRPKISDKVNQEVYNDVRRKVEPIEKTVNTMIQAMTHLGGSTDYAKTWDVVKSLVFPEQFPVEPTKAKPAPTKGKDQYEQMRKDVHPSNIDTNAPRAVTNDAIQGILREWETLTPQQQKEFQTYMKQIKGE